MTKQCQRCQIIFECNASDIKKCECYTIQLTEQAKVFINKNFENCLCLHCLIELNSLTHFSTFNNNN